MPESPSRNRPIEYALPALLSLALVISMRLLSGWAEIGWFWAITLLFVLPGIPLGLYFSRTRGADWGLTLVLTVGFGFALSGITNAITIRFLNWSLLLFSVIQAALFVALAVLTTRLSKPSRNDASRSTELSAVDRVCVCVATLMLLIALYIPFSRVGVLTHDGHVFASWFRFDFLMRVAYSAGVIRGVPLDNVCFSGHPMPNYLLFYAYLARMMNSSGAGADWNAFMMHSSLLLSLIFVLGLMYVLRQFIPNQAARLLVFFTGLFAYSYNAYYVIFKRLLAPAVPALQAKLKTAGFLSFSDASHGWYRDFLVEPHSCLALILLFCIILIVFVRAWQNLSNFEAAMVGLMTGAVFGVDSFLGLCVALWIGLYSLIHLLKRREEPLFEVARVPLFIFATFLLAAVLYLVTHTVFLSSEPALRLAVSKKFLLTFPVYLVLDFGGMALLGIAGLLTYVRGKRMSEAGDGLLHFAILFGVCLFLMLFVAHTNIYHIYVILRKGGKIIQLAFLVFSGLYLSRLFDRENAALKKFLCLLILIAGAPTLATDINNFSNVGDKKNIKLVTDADYRADEWLRTNTDIDAIVQSLPEYPGNYSIAHVAMLGLRRMALGNYIIASLSETVDDTFEERQEDMKVLFSSTDVHEILAVLRKYSIEYIYWGPFEQEYSLDAFEVYEAHPDIFENVYSQSGVDIFRVKE